jgi:hypothetical protein
MRFFLISSTFVAMVHATDRIRVADIGALTFRDGRMTTGRRLAPIPQLKCMTGECGEPAIESIQCTNSGADSMGTVQWKCEAIISGERQLGQTDVICEGYDGPGDEFVLSGSCGLQYSVIRTGNKTATDDSYGELFIVAIVAIIITSTMANCQCHVNRYRRYEDDGRRYCDSGYYHNRDYHREYSCGNYHTRPVYYDPCWSPHTRRQGCRSVNTDNGRASSTAFGGSTSL